MDENNSCVSRHFFLKSICYKIHKNIQNNKKTDNTTHKEKKKNNLNKY